MEVYEMWFTAFALSIVALLFESAYPIRFDWKKVGGLRFWRIGRLGGSFYISR